MEETTTLKLGEQPKEAAAEVEKKSDSGLSVEILQQMIATGENTDGMFSVILKKDELIDGQPIYEDKIEETTLTLGNIKEKFGQYMNKPITEKSNDGKDFLIDTPRGKMKIAEAIKRGYDPVTKTFRNKGKQQSFEQKLSKMDQKNRDAFKRITDPRNAKKPMGEKEQPKEGEQQIPPELLAQMQQQGNKQGEEQQTMPGKPAMQSAPQEAGQQIDPAMLAALGGGV